MTESTQSFPELLKELESATAAHRDASLEEQAASRRTTACFNRVNDLQKQINVAMSELHKAAPWDSVWKRKEKGEPEC